MALQHLRSSTANKRPVPGNMSEGQLAINSASGSPGLFFKDSNANLVKVGPVHVGTTAPNASPASGGTAGNSVGEQWLDTSGSNPVFKVWDGSAWQSQSGEFVNASGDVMTGALGIIAGSQGSPGLYFSGDTNTGIYSPGADQVALATGGTGRLFVDANGNVGVGATPASGRSLHLQGTGFQEILVEKTDATTGAVLLAADSGLAGIYTRTTAADSTAIPLAFHTGNAERLRITSDGKLGLGTSSPSNTLHVVGTGRFNVSGANNAVIASDGGDPFLYTEQTAGLKFGTNSSVRMTINSSGSVGIGTTGPLALLDVYKGSGSDYVDSIILSNSAGNGANQGIAWGSASNISARIKGLDDAAYGTHIIFENRTGGPSTSTTERARIDTSGRLLVGTTTDSQTSTLVLKGNSAGAANAGTLRIERGQGAGNITSSGIELGTIALGGSGIPSALVQAHSDGNWTAGTSYPTRLVFSTTADSASSPTERMRIGNAGLHSIYGDTNVLRLASNQGATTAFTIIQARRSETSTTSTTGSDCFRVFCNGNVENTNNSYGGISDAKLKENIVSASSQWDDLKTLQVRNYNFKEETGQQTHTQIGLIAQEVELVSPGLVSESPDRDEDGNDLGTVTKSVNYSVLYMKAVKALQEAMERIEVLEAKVNALEGN